MIVATYPIVVTNKLHECRDFYTRWFGPLHDYLGYAVIEIPDGWGSQADVTSTLGVTE